MKLVIAEKPSVGAAIAAVMGANEKRSGYFEGGGYLVSWCIGHLISLADAATYNEQFRKWKYDDLPIVPQEWQFIVASGKEQQFSILKDLMHRSDVTEIINACDSGREGELIFRFVYEQANCKKPFSRLWISSMEASAIREGFSNLKDGRGYDNLYQSALCRAKADWLIGINATRLFSILYHKTLNVGRVQTPTLAMLVNRDYAISSFKKEKYHVVRLDVGGVAALSERQDDEAAARQMKAACEKSQAVCTSLKKEKKTAAPPKLFDLTALQREANRLYGFTAKQTLDYAQALYEKRLLTYPRTDSKYITSDMEGSTKELITGLCAALPFMQGVKLQADLARICDNSKVTDHHAILPTAEFVKTGFSSLAESEKKLMTLVCAKLLCAVAAPYEYEAVDRHVKKGEKGIKIFAPAPYKVKKLVDKIDPETRKPMLDREGKVVKEEKEITVPAFKVITVFDISQTEGKEFPDLSVKPLLADVEQYEDFFAALEKASPVPIAFEQITNGANGYFSLTDKRIAIKEGVSELQAVKTAIHEIAHAKLHDVDLNAPPEQQNRVDRHTCEVEAESVAYTVCQHFGLDTSDYSFGYVAGWSSGKEMTELKASLETIQTTAKELITEIEGHFTELQQQRQAEQEQGDTFSIYQLKRGDETRDLRFEPYDRLQAAGLTIDRVNYELVYTAPLTKDMTLGDIWERFNIDHPADFKGHSLSVSDIVVLHQNDEDTAHYVDSIGFQQVPEFLQEQQTPVFDKLPPEQQQALSDTVQDTLQMLVDADKRIYGDVTGKTLEAIAAQGYSYKDGQLEKQQPEATPDSLLTGETVRTPRGNFHITDMSREQIEAAGFGFHHASEDGKYLIMGNGTQAYAIAAEQPQRDNPLKHVEDTIEQNDNNFDGLINNTPQTPTVADFEQRAKAGEAISVTDLAKAVKAEKREQPQKKPSILKKLDEYKKQAAQQPKDKQKEHKKDLEV